MGLLKFNVAHQHLSGGSYKAISGSIDYISAEFEFSEDWNGLDKWAHFQKGDIKYDVNLSEDRIIKEQHLNLEPGIWEVKLHGDQNVDGNVSMRITTSTAYVTVEDFGELHEGGVLPEIVASAAEQIAAKAENANINAKEALEKANSVFEAAENGEFDGEKGDPFTYDDFTAEQLEALRGPQGIPGEKGETGPFGPMGAAFTYEDFTEEQLLALVGPQGPQGEDGVGIESFYYDQSLADDGYNKLHIYLTNGEERVFHIKNGSKGSKGNTGNGIKEVTVTKIENENGGENLVTFWFDEGGHFDFSVMNGKPGEQGPEGPAGADGKTAYDYARHQGFSGTEEDFGLMLAGKHDVYGINVTVTKDGDVVTGQITNDQTKIIEAKKAGKPFTVFFSDGGRYANPKVSDTGAVSGAGIVFVDEEKVIYRDFYLSTAYQQENPAREMTDRIILTKDGDIPFFVTATEIQPGVYTADKTRAEIEEAYWNKKLCFCVIGADILSLSEMLDPTDICFSGAVEDEIITVRIGIDNGTQEDKVTVIKNSTTNKKVQFTGLAEETYDGTEEKVVYIKNPVYPVNIRNSADGYYADKTFAEILDAYSRGYEIYCNLLILEDSGQFHYYQRVPLESKVDFAATQKPMYFYFSSFSPNNLSLAGDRGVFIRIGADEKVNVQPGAAGIKNPYSLKFTGAVEGTYNGSEAVTIDVPAIAGPEGPQGPQGEQGVQGEKGDKGDKGDPGEQGPAGATGPQGPQGEQGPAGADGAKGEKGDTGATGPQGETGPQGPQGEQGPAGADGISPVVEVVDITGGHRVMITDKNGTKSFDVMDGEDGADGTGGSGGVSVNADLAENDSTAASYVKNRTHWMETTVHQNFEFDGVIDGKDYVHLNEGTDPEEVGQEYLVKLSDFFPASIDEIIGTKITYTEPWAGQHEFVVTESNIANRELGEEKCWIISDPDGNGAEVYIASADDKFKDTGSGKYIPKGISVYYLDDGTYTEKIEFPQPIKVEEIYHKLDKNYLPDDIGGSSETVEAAPSDWAINDPDATGYVKNRTHWVESGGETVVLEETVLGLMDDDPTEPLAAEGTLNLTVGNTYKVNWNGTEYICVAKELDATAMGLGVLICLGNMALMGGEDTGEPFGLAPVTYTVNGTVMKMIMAMSTEGLTSATVKITEKGEIVHKLHAKFLPEGYPYVEGDGETVIFEEATVEMSDAAINEALPLVVGNAYKVTWNGTEYTCVAYEFDATAVGMGVVPYIGNGVSFGLADTGEPFVIAPLAVGGVTLVASLDDTETATVGITKVGGTIHKMDNKFIDAEWMATVNTVKTTFIPETTIDTSSGDSNFGIEFAEGINLDDFKDGTDATVIFNGAEYNIPIVLEQMYSYKILFIGNWEILGFEMGMTPPDVPFCIMASIDESEISAETGATLALGDEHGFSNVTVKVVGDMDVPNKIPKEFLPENVYEKYYSFPVDLAECYQTDSPTNFTQEAIDGVMKAQEALTNGLLVMGTYQGIPCIVTRALYDTVDGGMHTLEFASFSERITFWNFGTTYHKYGKSELILASSTENSNKRFKITVDDSGTITATEV